MLIGINLPQSADPLPEVLWARIRHLEIGQFTISSRVHHETIERMTADFPRALVHVWPWINADTGPWPDQILDYRPSPRDRTLGECLDSLRRSLPAAQVRWVGGYQLAVSEDSDVVTANRGQAGDSHSEAIEQYAGWWDIAVGEVSRQFPLIPAAVAPLSQGSPELEWRWLRALKILGCYDRANYLADHNRFLDRPFADRAWGGRGVALRELLPELGPVHNLETHDGGCLKNSDVRGRAAVYARYLQWCAASGSYATVSMFEPGHNLSDDQDPPWCFLTPAILQANAEMTESD
ncbi:MAG: hypothetical protein ACKVVP_02325 [Chloroflexota bacterium]